MEVNGGGGNTVYEMARWIEFELGEWEIGFMGMLSHRANHHLIPLRSGGDGGGGSGYLLMRSTIPLRTRGSHPARHTPRPRCTVP